MISIINTSIFNNLTDEEFEQLLDEFEFSYKKVGKGEGGLLYKGTVYKSYEEFDKEYKKDN